MKKNYMKLIVTLACLTMLLTIAVSSTVAFLLDDSGPVVNQFKPTSVTTDIDEKFENNIKSEVVINNTSEIPVYIRVAVIGNWVNDEGEVVDAWTPNFTYPENWFSADGFYYYKNQVAAGGSTSDLLESNITTATREDGATLTVTVISQAIQGEPATAVQEAWGVTVNGTTITK